jgi:hypothetical protein
MTVAESRRGAIVTVLARRHAFALRRRQAKPTSATASAVAHSRTGKDDHRRMQELRAPAAKLPMALRDRSWFSTVADLCHWQQQPLPLEPAIWRKGRYMPGHADEKRPVVESEDLSRSLFPAPNSPASS